MKTLIIYDSLYGNTEKIARAVGSAIPGEVRVSRVGELNPSALETFDLVIIGSPTHGGRPTPAIQNFISGIPEASVEGVKAAAFDTRIPSKWVKIFGFAAGRIAGVLKSKGASVLFSEGFFVKGKEDSLKDGELERAAAWGREITRGQP